MRFSPPAHSDGCGPTRDSDQEKDRRVGGFALPPGRRLRHVAAPGWTARPLLPTPRPDALRRGDGAEPPPRVLRSRGRRLGPDRLRQALAARPAAGRGARVGAARGLPRPRARGRGAMVCGRLQCERGDPLRRARTGRGESPRRHRRRPQQGSGQAPRAVLPMGGPAGGRGARAELPLTGELALDAGPCLIRPWRRADHQSLVRHADNRHVWLTLRDQFPHPYTSADGEEWLTYVAKQRTLTNFAIVVDGEAAGGIRTASVRAFTAYAFDAYDLIRIFAAVFSSNPASMRVLEKAGYTREGVLRRSVVKDGQVLDQVLYAVTR